MNSFLDYILNLIVKLTTIAASDVIQNYWYVNDVVLIITVATVCVIAFLCLGVYLDGIYYKSYVDAYRYSESYYYPIKRKNW